MWDEVERVVEAVHARRPGDALAWMTSTFESIAELVGSLLGQVPVPVLALAVGLLAWRRRGLASGAVVALVVGLLALSRLWPVTIHTLVLVLVGAGLAALVLAVVMLLSKFVGRRIQQLMVLAPGVGAALAILVVVAFAALAKPFAGSGSQLSWVVTVGLTAGVLSAAYLVVDRPNGIAPALRAAISLSIGITLVLGMVGGFGLGGVVARAIEGGDIAGAADAAASVLLLGALLVVMGAEHPSEQSEAGQSHPSSGEPLAPGDEVAP